MIKVLAITAPNAQATLYQPAESPTVKAFSAIHMVNAPSIKRPEIVTAVIEVLFLPLYNKKSSLLSFDFFEITALIPSNKTTYKITMINGIFLISSP